MSAVNWPTVAPELWLGFAACVVLLVDVYAAGTAPSLKPSPATTKTTPKVST